MFFSVFLDFFLGFLLYLQIQHASLKYPVITFSIFSFYLTNIRFLSLRHVDEQQTMQLYVLFFHYNMYHAYNVSLYRLFQMQLSHAHF